MVFEPESLTAFRPTEDVAERLCCHSYYHNACSTCFKLAFPWWAQGLQSQTPMQSQRLALGLLCRTVLIQPFLHALPTLSQNIIATVSALPLCGHRLCSTALLTLKYYVFTPCRSHTVVFKGKWVSLLHSNIRPRMPQSNPHGDSYTPQHSMLLVENTGAPPVGKGPLSHKPEHSVLPLNQPLDGS